MAHDLFQGTGRFTILYTIIIFNDCCIMEKHVMMAWIIYGASLLFMNSSTLCSCLMRTAPRPLDPGRSTVSALVTQPEQARQSERLTCPICACHEALFAC